MNLIKRSVLNITTPTPFTWRLSLVYDDVIAFCCIAVPEPPVDTSTKGPVMYRCNGFFTIGLEKCSKSSEVKSLKWGAITVMWRFRSDSWLLSTQCKINCWTNTQILKDNQLNSMYNLKWLFAAVNSIELYRESNKWTHRYRTTFNSISTRNHLKQIQVICQWATAYYSIFSLSNTADGNGWK